MNNLHSHSALLEGICSVGSLAACTSIPFIKCTLILVCACRNGSPVWNGSSDFYFEDQYLHFASQIGLNSVTMYGVGERVGDLALSPGKYAMWNRDQGRILENHSIKKQSPSN